MVLSKRLIDLETNFSFALMASGEGTNVRALLKSARSLGVLSLIKVLICDREGAKVLEVARDFDLPCMVIVREKNESREAHEQKISMALRVQGVNFLLLAGYTKILSASFVSKFKNRILNIHPSLLPAYPGLNSYERAYNDGVSESGVTIHYVTEGVDEGPIFMQERFKRLPDDDLESFTLRGKKLEHELFPKAFQQLLELENS